MSMPVAKMMNSKHPFSVTPTHPQPNSERASHKVSEFQSGASPSPKVKGKSKKRISWKEPGPAISRTIGGISERMAAGSGGVGGGVRGGDPRGQRPRSQSFCAVQRGLLSEGPAAIGATGLGRGTPACAGLSPPPSSCLRNRPAPLLWG